MVRILLLLILCLAFTPWKLLADACPGNSQTLGWGQFRSAEGETPYFLFRETVDPTDDDDVQFRNFEDWLNRNYSPGSEGSLSQINGRWRWIPGDPSVLAPFAGACAATTETGAGCSEGNRALCCNPSQPMPTEMGLLFYGSCEDTQVCNVPFGMDKFCEKAFGNARVTQTDDRPTYLWDRQRICGDTATYDLVRLRADMVNLTSQTDLHMTLVNILVGVGGSTTNASMTLANMAGDCTATYYRILNLPPPADAVDTASDCAERERAVAQIEATQQLLETFNCMRDMFNNGTLGIYRDGALTDLRNLTDADMTAFCDTPSAQLAYQPNMDMGKLRNHCGGQDPRLVTVDVTDATGTSSVTCYKCPGQENITINTCADNGVGGMKICTNVADPACTNLQQRLIDCNNEQFYTYQGVTYAGAGANGAATRACQNHNYNICFPGLNIGEMSEESRANLSFTQENDRTCINKPGNFTNQVCTAQILPNVDDYDGWDELEMEGCFKQGSLTVRLTSCIKSMSTKTTALFLVGDPDDNKRGFYEVMRPIVAMMILLAVTLFGFKLAMGMLRQPWSELALFIIKIAFVGFMSFNIDKFAPYIFDMQDQVLRIVTNTASAIPDSNPSTATTVITARVDNGTPEPTLVSRTAGLSACAHPGFDWENLAQGATFASTAQATRAQEAYEVWRRIDCLVAQVLGVIPRTLEFVHADTTGVSTASSAAVQAAYGTDYRYVQTSFNMGSGVLPLALQTVISVGFIAFFVIVFILSGFEFNAATVPFLVIAIVLTILFLPFAGGGLINPAVIAMGIIALIFVFGTLLSLLKALLIYCYGVLSLALMVMLFPLVLPMIMFAFTKIIFDRWIRIVSDAFVQPMLLYAFLVMFVALTTPLMTQALEDIKYLSEKAGPFSCSIVDCGGVQSSSSQSVTTPVAGQNVTTSNCQNTSTGDANQLALHNTSYRCSYASMDEKAVRRVTFDLFGLAVLFFVMLAFSSKIPEMSKRFVSLFDVAYAEKSDSQIRKIIGVERFMMRTIGQGKK